MVISPNEYRWDFIGLSTEDKPTPATSENVTNGSTLFEVDTSKLYVWCDTEWYEKQSTGGGGGGDTPVIKALTNDDLNYPEGNPNRVALCDLPTGFYYRDRGMSKVVCASHSTTTSEQLSSSPVEYAAVVRENDDYVCVYMYGVYGDRAVRIWKGNTQNFYQRPKEVVDNLTSTDEKAALSAKQGKVLNDKINVVTLPLTLDDNTGVITSQQTAAQIKTLISEGKGFIPRLVLSDGGVVEGGVVIMTPLSDGCSIIIYVFDGDNENFVMIPLGANHDADYLTGNLPA